VAGRLDGERAIVTGSTGRGLGTEIARVFAAEGAMVVVTGRSEDNGRALVQEIEGRGGTAYFVPADLADRGSCQSLVDAAVGRMAGLSILVNCAVASPVADGSITEVSDDVWEAALAINVTAVLHLCRHAIPVMTAAGRGSIVNIGSRVAIRGVPDQAAYTASKGALHALTRSIAMDHAADGVRCNVIAAGYIAGKERYQPDEDRLEWAQAMHLTRLPTVTDVAIAAVYLASRESEVVTGAELPVDGGGMMARGLTLG
jgi:meso-butanediol dehydrogenase/(S,S)-butanediol dehydrogenase/diacetyl reductase